MSHLANLTPRSPSGMSPEERTQRRSLKAGSQVEVDPSKELTEPGRAMTTSGKHDPHAGGNRDHHPQKYATKKQACDTSSNRAPRRCHVLIVGRVARLVFGVHWRTLAQTTVGILGSLAVLFARLRTARGFRQVAVSRSSTSATPSLSFDAVTSSANSATSGCALATATPRPAHVSIGTSFG
jgi:hypothetical protein